jgi:hypothetical protein
MSLSNLNPTVPIEFEQLVADVAAMTAAVVDSHRWRRPLSPGAPYRGKFMLTRFDLSALSRSRSARSVLAFLFTVVAILLMTFSSRAWHNKIGSAMKQDPVAALPMANTSQDPTPEVVLIVLTPQGFDETVITRPKGKFLLVVESRLGLKEPSFALSRIVGNNSKDKLKDGVIKKGRRNWSEELDLNPGEYELTEVNNPDWSCKLTITPK